MAKTKIATRKKGSKRHKASVKLVRKAAAKRTMAKKAKSKVRRAGGVARRSMTKKQQPSKVAATEASRKTLDQLVEPLVKDAIIDMIGEPARGVVDVTEVETIDTANSTPPPAS